MEKHNEIQKIIFFTLFMGISIGLITSSLININFNKTKEVSILENEKKIEKKENIEQILVQEDTIENEFVNINIKSGYTCNEITDLLYQKELISNKEDFKIIYNIMLFDVYGAGDSLTEKGIVSKGWKIKTLTEIILSKRNKVVDILYKDGLVDDKYGLDTILNSVNSNKKIVYGEKKIKKGSSNIEIIDILTK
ncbi:MAG: hypothetical protein N4A48_04290 [Tepidibacter sp.]|jgi:cell division protein YceG involved in septum cleavage|uniref:hypothetical protein n=1 Tax=Tepidibacter sp. TaxID=2529387 RepID=UPI0025E27B96|nr:hypothetical protein [Tepidibacter sp.]MCT4507970.1 hypothetical protein [Tepidibacter sp.]